MCSPDLAEQGGTFYLTYNSWRDKPGVPNQLFYATSTDLERWSPGQPLAADLATRTRAIDAALAFANGRCYLPWKRQQRPVMAVADSLAAAHWSNAFLAASRPGFPVAQTTTGAGATFGRGRV